MKIAYVTAGAAGMYCGSCLHDNTLASALIGEGHEVALIPTYTPIRTDETDVSIDRVFYGAINVFLEQKSALFRHSPRMVSRLLDSPGLLGWASRRGASVDARELGDMTLSVLQGEDGKQRKELDRLVEWLVEFQPDIVHLTNSMFLGVAHRIKQALGVPVLCAVQGEDIFLDDLFEPHGSRVRETLREKARDVDGFTATSSYYVDFMTDYLRIPAEKMHFVPLGLKLDGHGSGKPLEDERPFTIGYLARICPEKGLHDLVEAFKVLTGGVGRDQVRLRIAGYLGERDADYIEHIRNEIRSADIEDSVDYVGEVDRAGKIAFLQALHVLSVPTTYREPKGLYVLEALANGIPVVQPRHGAFPELIEATGGGVLFEPGSVTELADALQALMNDPNTRTRLGRDGKEAVHRDYSDTRMARATLKLYGRYVQNSPGP